MLTYSGKDPTFRAIRASGLAVVCPLTSKRKPYPIAPAMLGTLKAQSS